MGMKETNRAPSISKSQPPVQKRRLVLLVEESEAERRLLGVQLMRAGFVVANASSGEEALRFCARTQPDIVLSSWAMQGMSGLDFCRRFRAMSRDSYGYFILLTDRAERDEVARGLESGADDMLIRPVSGAELLARLSASMRILNMEEELRQSNRALRLALDQLNEAQDSIERDLREARRLQQGLVRERHGRFEDMEVSLLIRPAGHLGGDLVGFFPINARRIGLFAIDVSGHGVAAALLTARLAAYLSGASDQNVALRLTEFGLYDARPPADLAKYLNHLMLEDMRTDSYFTMVYADLDVVSGDLRLVQAGHPHPIIQRADGSLDIIGNGGMPIGVFETASYEEVHARLYPGDRLFIASDGITEATDPRGHLMGEEGLQAILRTNAPLRGTALLESLAWSVSEYSKGQRPDDISAIFVEYLGDAECLPFPSEQAGKHG